jgi:hypothetical protein
MSENNTELQLSEPIGSPDIGTKPKQTKKKPAGWRKENMEKARLARLEKLKQEKEAVPPPEYEIQEDEGDSSSDSEEIDASLLKALFKPKSSSQNKSKTATDPKMIDRLDRLETIMTQMIDLQKKDRKKAKKIQKKAANTQKVVLIPPAQPTQTPTMPQIPKQQQGNLEHILKYLQRGVLS